MKKKSYLNMKVPIQFVSLTKSGGWYFRRTHKRGPLIQISTDLELFHKIRLLYHEFTHQLIDYLADINDARLIKDIKTVTEDTKIIRLNTLSDKQEERLAEKIGMFAKDAFYTDLVYKKFIPKRSKRK